MRKYLITALMLSGIASAAGTPAGTEISNIGTLELSDSVGGPTTQINSAPVVVTVQQVYNLTVTPNGTTDAPGQTYNLAPGATGTLTYELTNTGNGNDTFNVAALNANGLATGTVVGVYRDNPTAGTVGTFDANDTLITNTGSLAADAKVTLFVRYTMPAAAPAGQAHQLDLRGTSTGDTGRTDTNNVGQFTTARVIDLSLTSTQSKTVAAGSSVTFTDTLTNTGNAPISASEIVTATTGAATNGLGTGIANNFTVNYTVAGPNGTFTAATLQGALNQAISGGLNAGAGVTITVTVTPPANVADRDALTLNLNAYSNAVPSGSLVNNALQNDPQGAITNTTTVQRGIGNVVKTGAICTFVNSALSCPDENTSQSTTFSAKPGDYVVYYLKATNSGTGNLYNVRLSDALPANFVPTHLGAATDATGTIKFSTNGTTWTNDVTTLGVLTGGSSVIYTSVENGGNANTIDASDVLTANNTLTLRIVGYIRDGGVTGSAVTRDDTGLTPQVF